MPMKHLLLCATLLPAIAVCMPAQPAKVVVPFSVYTSYFERNDSGLPGEASYLVLGSQPEFDRVFGAAAVMGKNSFLPPATFPNSLVLATVLRGNLRHYHVQSVTRTGATLQLAYTVQEDKAGTAQFRSPLIVVVPKGPYNAVEFIEGRHVMMTVPVAH